MNSRKKRGGEMKSKNLILIFIFLIILVIPIRAEAVVRLEGIENFPYSYQPYLLELQRQFPQWRFVALYTGFDWEYVIDNQNVVRQKFSADVI